MYKEKRFAIKIQRSIKYLFDKIFSIFLLIVLAPILLFFILAIKIDSKGPIFFIQERVGQYGEIFKMYKFRTMVENSIHMGDKEYTGSEDARITRMGTFLRKTSIDELPQLINVLKGEMSLIGPRPTLSFQVERYSTMQKRRLEYRPGISNLPAVRGRNLLSWSKRIELDVWYIDHWSLWLDFKIFWATIQVVLTGKGVYGDRKANDV